MKKSEVWLFRKYRNKEEFEVRFLSISLAHYINEAYIEQVLEILNHTIEGYYVENGSMGCISLLCQI